MPVFTPAEGRFARRTLRVGRRALGRSGLLTLGPGAALFTAPGPTLALGILPLVLLGSLALPGLRPRLGLSRLYLSGLGWLRLPWLGWLCLSGLRGGLPGRAGLSSLGTRRGLPLRGLLGGRTTCLRRLPLPRLRWLRLPRLRWLRLSRLEWLCLPRLGCGWILTRLAGLRLPGLVRLGLARWCVLRLRSALTILARCRLFTALRALTGLAGAGCLLGLSLARGLAPTILRFLATRLGPFRRTDCIRALLLALRRTFRRQGLSGLWAGIGLGRAGWAIRLG